MNENFKANLRQNRFTVSLREGVPVPGSGGGGDPQTPWLSNIDAAQFHLDNATRIAGVPTANGTPYLFFGTGMAQGNVTLAAAGTGSISLQSPSLRISSPLVEIAGATPSRLYIWGDVDITGQYLVNSEPISAGGSQTPWVQDVDAAKFSLNNISTVTAPSDGNLVLLGVASSYIMLQRSPNTMFITPWYVDWQLNSFHLVATSDYTVQFTAENHKIGINTTNPAYALDVVGDVNVTGNIIANGPGTLSNFSGSLSLVTQAGGLYGGVDSGLGVGFLQAAMRGAYFQSLLLNPHGGSIGINRTTYPAYPLDVNGDINLTGSLRFNGVAVTVDANGFLKLE